MAITKEAEAFSKTHSAPFAPTVMRQSPRRHAKEAKSWAALPCEVKEFIMEYYLEGILQNEMTWPDGYYDTPDSWLEYAERGYMSQQLTQYQHHFILPLMSQNAANIGARVSHRLAVGRKHRDGEAALPVFDLSVPDDTVYDSWTMGARERERLRRLSESLLRVMGTRAAPYTLRVA